MPSHYKKDVTKGEHRDVISDITKGKKKMDTPTQMGLRKAREKAAAVRRLKVTDPSSVN